MNGDSYSRDGGRHGGRDYQGRRDRDDRRDRGDRGDRADRGDRGDRGERGDRADRGGDRDRDNRGTGRRRSRSPGRGYRERDSRREDGDVDMYQSSRNHRDREREDRYSGRDDRRGGAGSGGGRDWDRDRMNRRQEDDGRRRRDPFEDRRGGGMGGGGRDRGRGGGGDRDNEFERQARQRSPTPPPKKREPTPDLTNVVSVLERKRRLTQWDIKPPGYENVTAEQAKLSGMFPLPGAPRQQAMDPTKLQAFMSQPGGQVNSAALKPGNSRQSKRLLVSNIPSSVSEEDIMAFFNLQLNGLNVVESTDPCSLCQLSNDHSFAMLEFKTSADATVALALDGTSMEAEDRADTHARGLQIRRPKDYIVPAVVDESIYDADAAVPSSVVIDTPNKISVTNLPPYLSDDQVLELLVSFGKLKAFVLVKDKGTDESRGIAFLEYAEPAATDVAIQGLNNMKLGEHGLRVQKASIGITQVAGVEMGVNAMSMLAGTTSADSEASRVVQLLNMVTSEELMDNDDYEEIKEDVEEECAKFGSVVAVKIPRPAGGSRQSAGVGKIFVKFDTAESAKKAMQALAGRKFADRTVVTTYFPEENFDVGAW